MKRAKSPRRVKIPTKYEQIYLLELENSKSQFCNKQNKNQKVKKNYEKHNF